MNNYIDVSDKNAFTTFYEDVTKIHSIMISKDYDTKIVRKIIKNKKYNSMGHYNVLHLLNKLKDFNIVRKDFHQRLTDIDKKPLIIDKTLIKFNYNKNKDKNKEDDKKDKDSDDDEDDNNDDNIDEKLVDIGIEDGVFRYLYFINLELRFLKIQIKKTFLKDMKNKMIYINELIDILTTHVFSKHKDNVFILDINLKKQALLKYFNKEQIDENTCTVCLTAINTELEKHHTIYCLECSAIYCPVCYEKIKPFCSICKKLFK